MPHYFETGPLPTYFETAPLAIHFVGIACLCGWSALGALLVGRLIRTMRGEGKAQ